MHTLLLSDIPLRDPFVLPWRDGYVMTGTRAASCWGKADGFDAYTSQDLVHWSEPIEIFHRPDDFWSDSNFWAPEIHPWKGAYYLFASFYSTAEKRRGTQILHADSPLGPYHPHSDGPVTPRDWMCLDGTFHVDASGKPWMVFCHEWCDPINHGEGSICAVRLTDDLRAPVGEPIVLFAAHGAAPWIRPSSKPGEVPEVWVTDGPFLHRLSDGTLAMLWSSFAEGHRYAQALARSSDGSLTGRWTTDATPLFDDDGGHGMLFRARDGRLLLALHRPNTPTPQERPVFLPLSESDLLR